MFFSGKTVWVIGASSGIGAELCRQLAKRGAIVVLSARTLSKLQEVKTSLKCPHKHILFPIDLENTLNIVEKTKELISLVGEVHFLFNNGGLSQRATAFDTQIQVDRRIMEINYFGNIAVTKAILPQMRKQGGGTIVVISSIAGKFGFFLRSAYSASKHALHGFYESLRLEEENHNIRVNIMCPGKINTEISKHALTDTGATHNEMDHNQKTGMEVEVCVNQILKAVIKNKRETLIGGQETKAVFMKRFFPNVFYKIIKNQSAV